MLIAFFLLSGCNSQSSNSSFQKVDEDAAVAQAILEANDNSSEYQEMKEVIVLAKKYQIPVSISMEIIWEYNILTIGPNFIPLSLEEEEKNKKESKVVSAEEAIIILSNRYNISAKTLASYIFELTGR